MPKQLPLCPNGHGVSRVMEFCPRCGEKIPEAQSTDTAPKSSKKKIGKRIGLVIVGLLALVGFGAIVEGFDDNANTTTGSAENTLTPEQLAVQACQDDYVWAINQLDRSPDQGLTAVHRQWGTEDGRLYIATDFYHDFVSYRNSHGQQRASELIVTDISLHCVSPDTGSDQSSTNDIDAYQGHTCEAVVASALEVYASDYTARDGLLEYFTMEGQQVVSELMDYVSETDLSPEDAPTAMGNIAYDESLCVTATDVP